MQKNKIGFNSIAIWAITPNGKILGRKIQAGLKGSALFVSAGILEGNQLDTDTYAFTKLSKEIHRQFNKFSGHVFIFSTGIAVRIIAPLLESKVIDPAVVVADDNGTHAISLLSGHLGGANALTKKIAPLINAMPVITTATDINQLPSIDLIAKDNGLYIETLQNIKVINMAFLMGKPISLYDPLGLIKNNLPKTCRSKTYQSSIFGIDKIKTGSSTHKIFCSYESKNVSRETLILRPPVLSIGIGCNRGTGYEEIKRFLLMVLKKEGLSLHSVYRFATADIKKDEAGLLTLSKEMKIRIDFYGKKDLNSVKTIETPSKMVEKHLGVKSVCEAAAILSADNGKLIVPKNKNKDVTIAVAIKK